MLKKSLRLTTKELENVLKTGNVVHSPLFTLRYIKDQNSTKYAVVVAKKIIGSSVGRHAAKRLIYDLIPSVASRITPGVWAAIFVKNGSIEEIQKLNKGADGINVGAESFILELFKKAHILI